jgi:hypothetical protein
MSYIYDILLNWVDTYPYEFYEWQLDDDIENVKKIPIIKVDTNKLRDLLNDDIIIDVEILDIIYQKTEVVDNRSISYIEYGCIFTDGNKALAIEFDKEGYSLYKSLLLIDEEQEILEISIKLEAIDFKYKVIKEYKNKNNLTRNEKKLKEFLINEFEKIYDTKNIDKLKYIYFEWYNKTSDDFNYMYNKVKKILSISWDKKHDNIYNLLMLANMKKQL